MDKREFIKSLKSLLFSNDKSEKIEVEMIYYTTSEGLELRIPEGSELIAGTEVSILDESGEYVIAPEGEYQIEDSILVIGEAGIILEIKPVEEEESEESEEGSEDETPDEAEMARQEEIEKRFAAIENAIAGFAEAMSAVENLSETVNKLAESPADEEIKLSKSTESSKRSKLDTREQKLNFFSKR